MKDRCTPQRSFAGAGARVSGFACPGGDLVIVATEPCGLSKPVAATVSGLAAGVAFLLVLEADLRLTGRNVDDLILLGRPMVRDPKHARRAGLAIHLVNSIALAQVYRLVENRLPGSPSVKGMTFANIENVLLYPATYLEDLHPAVRDGQVDRYFSWPAFWQSVPRHIAYGAVLGSLYARLTRR